MGLFDFFTPENGPCNECEHKNGPECRKFYAQKHYSRVSGTSYTYHSCEVARSNSGFCGHKGKYWTERSSPDRNNYNSYSCEEKDACSDDPSWGGRE